MTKGISPIIAIIILVVITIGLAATAYMFFSGLVTGRMVKVISIVDASCEDENITLFLRNEGTTNITVTSGSGDLKVFVDGSDDTQYFYEDYATQDNTYTITPSGVIMLKGDKNHAGYSSGSHTLIVVTRSNSQTQRILC